MGQLLEIIISSFSQTTPMENAYHHRLYYCHSKGIEDCTIVLPNQSFGSHIQYSKKLNSIVSILEISKHRYPREPSEVERVPRQSKTLRRSKMDLHTTILDLLLPDNPAVNTATSLAGGSQSHTSPVLASSTAAALSSSIDTDPAVTTTDTERCNGRNTLKNRKSGGGYLKPKDRETIANGAAKLATTKSRPRVRSSSPWTFFLLAQVMGCLATGAAASYDTPLERSTAVDDISSKQSAAVLGAPVRQATIISMPRLQEPLLPVIAASGNVRKEEHTLEKRRGGGGSGGSSGGSGGSSSGSSSSSSSGSRGSGSSSTGQNGKPLIVVVPGTSAASSHARSLSRWTLLLLTLFLGFMTAGTTAIDGTTNYSIIIGMDHNQQSQEILKQPLEEITISSAIERCQEPPFPILGNVKREDILEKRKGSSGGGSAAVNIVAAATSAASPRGHSLPTWTLLILTLLVGFISTGSMASYASTDRFIIMVVDHSQQREDVSRELSKKDIIAHRNDRRQESPFPALAVAVADNVKRRDILERVHHSHHPSTGATTEESAASSHAHSLPTWTLFLLTLIVGFMSTGSAASYATTADHSTTISMDHSQQSQKSLEPPTNKDIIHHATDRRQDSYTVSTELHLDISNPGNPLGTKNFSLGKRNCVLGHMTNDLACFKHSGTSPTRAASNLYRAIVACGALVFFVEGATCLDPLFRAEARAKKKQKMSILEPLRQSGALSTKERVLSIRPSRDIVSLSNEEGWGVGDVESRRHHDFAVHGTKGVKEDKGRIFRFTLKGSEKPQQHALPSWGLHGAATTIQTPRHHLPFASWLCFPFLLFSFFVPKSPTSPPTPTHAMAVAPQSKNLLSAVFFHSAIFGSANFLTILTIFTFTFTFLDMGFKTAAPRRHLSLPFTCLLLVLTLFFSIASASAAGCGEKLGDGQQACLDTLSLSESPSASVPSIQTTLTPAIPQSTNPAAPPNHPHNLLHRSASGATHLKHTTSKPTSSAPRTPPSWTLSLTFTVITMLFLCTAGVSGTPQYREFDPQYIYNQTAEDAHTNAGSRLLGGGLGALGVVVVGVVGWLVV